MVRDFERHKESYRVAIIAALLTATCFLIYELHIVGKSDLSFTHFFYVPIILAAYWWKKKGMVVAVFLSLFMISSSFLTYGHSIYQGIYGAIMFMIVSFLVVILRVQTETKEGRIKQLVAQNKLILEAAGEGILGLDLKGNHTFVNPAAAKMLGYEEKELVGSHSHSKWHHTKADGTPYPEEDCPIYLALKDGVVHHSRDEVFWKKDNTSFNVAYTSTPIIDDKNIVGAVVTFRDITERKLVEEQLQSLSTLDGLTGIANRRAFDAFLDEEWKRARRGDYKISMMLIDVDHFKSYNDTYGHLEGDECLIQVARVLKQNAQRPGDLTARFGGEEFAIVFTTTDDGKAKRFAEKIRREIEGLKIPHEKSNISYYLTVSIGVASVTPIEKSSQVDLIKFADDALYKAKKEGRNRMVFAG